jgi:hypothetical protein
MKELLCFPLIGPPQFDRPPIGKGKTENDWETITNTGAWSAQQPNIIKDSFYFLSFFFFL